MKKIDVEKLIDKKGADPKEIALHLFPEHKHPDLALRRVILGKSNLDSDQISKLAALLNCSILELFEGGGFKSTMVPGGKYIFENEDYKAILDLEAWKTDLFHKGSLFHTEFIHPKSIPLQEYIDRLTLLIAKHEFGEEPC